MMCRAFLSFLVAAGSACGADWEFGIRGGIPLTKALTGQNTPFSPPSGLEFLPGEFNGTRAYTRRYVVGPTAHIGLAKRFSFRVEALYSRVASDSAFHSFSVSGTSMSGYSATRYKRWQIPLLIESQPWQRNIIFAAGPSVSLLSAGKESILLSRGLFDRGWNFFRNSGSVIPNRRAIPGFTAEAGYFLRRSYLRVTPTLRYTHWFGSHFDALSERWNRTQWQFLIALSLGRK